MLPRSTCASKAQAKAKARSTNLIMDLLKTTYEINYHLRHLKAIFFLTAQALPTLVQQGHNAFRAKDWPRAERLFSEAVRSEPTSAPAHKWLGMTYAAQEKFALAEAPFRRACELDQKEPDACYYWGRTLFSLSRF